MTAPLPLTADELTPAWLTDALAARFAGVRVAAVEVLERHEVTNAHARIALTYDVAAGAPPSMFVKLPPPGAERRAVIAATGMGEREARFYDDLAPHLSLRVPDAYVTRYDPANGDFVLLLEDLVATGAAVSDGSWGIPPDVAARALVELAELHARYEDPARRAAEAPWVREPTFGSNYGPAMLTTALTQHRDRISDAFAAIARIYIDHTAALQTVWHRGPHTVIHGDPHLGNLFVDGERCGFLDWGIINLSTPLREVSYFITMSLDVEDRRTHERELLAHYLDARRALGATPIGAEEAWQAHRLQAGYTVPASCQIVTFPEGISERRRIFSESFLAKAEAAVDDLDALGAIEAARDW